MSYKRGFSRFSTAVAGSIIGVLAACSQHAAPANGPGESNQVSVGYGTQDASSVTGAVTSLSPDRIQFSYSRIEELLETRVPGLMVVRQGGSFSLRMRGVSTLSGNAEPLVVIDGMPTAQFGGSSALAAINPRDVERIDVLRDGASTAVYGLRGVNGVILITTKH